MQFNNLLKKTKNKKSRTVGRGGKRGKTSGRGTKGQNARAGRKKRPEQRDMIKKLPKLRGRGSNSLKSIVSKPIGINLSSIDKKFKDGEKVSPESLIKSGLLITSGGKNPKVKILATGEINKKIELFGCSFSEKAKEKIEKVGGKVL